MKRYARGKEAQMANAQIKIFLEEMSTKGKTRAVEELHERINAITQNYNLDLEKFLEIIYNGLDKLEINIRKQGMLLLKTQITIIQLENHLNLSLVFARVVKVKLFYPVRVPVLVKVNLFARVKLAPVRVVPVRVVPVRVVPVRVVPVRVVPVRVKK